MMPPLRVEKTGPREWKLLEEFCVYSCGQWVKVPKGFRTNFASIPRIFWRVLPPVGAYDQAAVVHDYLYSIPTFPRAKADEIFLDLMGRCKVPAWQRYPMWAAVRGFGGWWRASGALMLVAAVCWGCRASEILSPRIEIASGVYGCEIAIYVYGGEGSRVIQTKEVPVEIGRGASVPIGAVP